MFVGEAPGKDEVREGRPFVGAAGQTLRKFLLMVGVDPDECYYSNLCKYQPPRNKLGVWFDRDGRPGPLILQGLLELEQEILQVQPNILVALGNFPGWALTGQLSWDRKVRGFTGITSYRGSMYPSRLGNGVKVLTTFHPSYITREGMADHGTWLADLRRVAEEAKTPELKYPEPRIYVYKDNQSFLITNPVDRSAPIYEPHGATLTQLRDHLLEDMDATLTIDIEYIGENLLCCGFTTSRDEAHVVVNNQGEAVGWMKSVLESGIRLNAQNTAFEASILEWHYGIQVMPNIYYDTMLAAHATNIELPKDLGYLTSIYTRQPHHKGMVNWNEVRKGNHNLDVVWKYNGIDVWTEHAIMEEQIEHDLDDAKVNAVYLHEMALLPPLWEMSKRGIK